MKKILLFVSLFLLISSVGYSQQPTTSPTHRTCGTDEAMKKIFDNDPKARERYENLQKQLEMQLNAASPQLSQNRTQALTTIPVVVHIVLPNPNLVADATIQNQLDTLNWFYGAASATDSLRVYAPFRATYGRSEIRFCKAVRDPNNQPTTGINRITSSSTFTAGGTHPSTIAPAWNTNKYLNIWVVTFTDNTLGYSYLPGTFAAGDQRAGFVNDYRAFGSGASYLYSSYNLGRTAVHEIGHYFNLNHPWGPNNSGNPTCTLDDGCADTPPTNGPTFGCPSLPVLNACSSAAPGIMLQNHMDYADDGCMFLFTQCQATRINNSLTATDRVGLITSLGCQPVNLLSLDASISSINNPVAGQSFCGTTTIAPTIQLTNSGLTTLTSAIITTSLDGGAPISFNWTGSLVSLASTSVTLANVTGLSGGSHSLNICVTNPNTGTDLDNSNNCKTVTFNIVTAGAGVALSESFEGTTFPPASWILTQTSGSGNWARVTTAAKTGIASAKFNNYLYTAGTASSLTTPPVSFATAAAKATLTFQYAHKSYSGEPDKLEVFVSTDCGITWTSLWARSGSTGANALITSAGNLTTPFTPTSTQWTQTPVTIDLTAYKSQTIRIKFTATSGYGNNLYLDDINIFGTVLPQYDAKVAEILKPGSTFCELPQYPKVRVTNAGTQTLTSLTVAYTLNGSTPVSQKFSGLNLPLSRDTILNLDSIPITSITAGTVYTFKAYTSLPNNQVDQNVSNDTSIISTVLLTPKSIPFTESFENSTFAATNWEIVNTNNDVTWERFTSPKIVASHLSAAAGIKNYRYTPTGRVDYLVSPLTKFTANDTAIIKFDVAAATYQYPGSTVISLDTLELQFSTDCGANWITIYKKWGDQLQTIHNPNNSYIDTFYVNNASQWRTDSVVLGTILANGGFARFRFKNTCFGGNNIFIDNINLYSKTLSPNVKQNGYTVSPNPASNVITIQHYLQPSKLRGVGFYNSAGQRVLYRSYNGNADSYLTFNVSGLAAGVYTVKLEYTNKTISEKVIKL